MVNSLEHGEKGDKSILERSNMKISWKCYIGHSISDWADGLMGLAGCLRVQVRRLGGQVWNILYDFMCITLRLILHFLENLLGYPNILCRQRWMRLGRKWKKNDVLNLQTINSGKSVLALGQTTWASLLMRLRSALLLGNSPHHGS